MSKTTKSEKVKAFFGFRQNTAGEEILDPTPVTAPVRLNRHMSQQEIIKAAVAAALAQERVLGEVETVDEMLDFDIEDDPDDPLSPYEEDDFNVFVRPEVSEEIAKEVKRQWFARKKAAKPSEKAPGPEVPEAPKQRVGASGPSPEGENS